MRASRRRRRRRCAKATGAGAQRRAPGKAGRRRGTAGLHALGGAARPSQAGTAGQSDLEREERDIGEHRGHRKRVSRASAEGGRSSGSYEDLSKWRSSGPEGHRNLPDQLSPFPRELNRFTGRRRRWPACRPTHAERARASLAQAITGAKLINDYRWVSYATASLLFEQDVDIVNAHLAGRWEAPQHNGFRLWPVLDGYGAPLRPLQRKSRDLSGPAHAPPRSGAWKGSSTRSRSRPASTIIAKRPISRTCGHCADRTIIFSPPDPPALLAIPVPEEQPGLCRTASSRTAESRRNTTKPGANTGRGCWTNAPSAASDVEVGSPTYEDETRQAIQNIRDFAEDPTPAAQGRDAARCDLCPHRAGQLEERCQGWRQEPRLYVQGQVLLRRR